LYSIQNDFSRIIVVSHLPVFKDNFPIHFQIQKTPSGSTISVEERG
jgi:DNA repair exonuclease SbcCD ATPase subunit